MDQQEYIKSLDEKRKRAFTEQRQYIDDAIKAHPTEPLSGEERQYVERTDSEIDAMDADINAFYVRNKRENENGVLRESHAAVFGDGALEQANQSEAATMRQWARGEVRTQWSSWDGGKPNAYLMDLRPAARRSNLISQFGIKAEDAEGRALLWDTGSIASGVPTTTSNVLYQLMTAGIAAFRMPTTKITTDSGETMYFPRINAHGIGTQVIAQGTAIGGTDPTFARMQLDAYKYGQLVQVASETISDNGFDVLTFVAGNVGRAVAQVADADLIVGTGSGEPNGQMAVAWTGAAGTVATGGTLITPTYENLVDLVYSVNDQYRQSSASAWLMRDATAGIIRKIRDGAGGTIGQPIWQMAPWQALNTGEPDRLLGFPVYTDPNVASCASNARIATFGDWNAYYTRLVGSFVFERSDEYAFNVDEVTFRGKQRLDGDGIDVTAVNLLKQSV